MNGDWKEFHLVAEPVVREIAPGMKAHLWGYNGQSPGPTIEVVEGDKIRIFVTNNLPEPTSVHWHGVLLPSGMDGVGGLTQPHISPGKTFVYEFQLQTSGTHMYHPHTDEMLQIAMGMMGSFIIHPRNPNFMPVDRDFVFLLHSFRIDPGSYVPRTAEMVEFNIWTFNSRVFPGIDHLAVRKGDRLRVRIGNLSMTSHPIHLHGYHFHVTGTDGGWIPESAHWPETTTNVPVGSMRAFEVIANAPGDWALHCHKTHHMMNAMSHQLITHIGADMRDVAQTLEQLAPGAHPMGQRGMAEMANMQMPIPENTLPMMGGPGPFGTIDVAGMFTVVKVREDLAPNDYKDPGWYEHPPGTVAYQWQGNRPSAATAPARYKGARPQGRDIELKAVKPRGGGHH